MAPPRPLRPYEEGSSQTTAMRTFNVDLARLKGFAGSLPDPAALFSFSIDGFSVLHCAAYQGHVQVCKYLVGELGGDVNLRGPGGLTPFMVSGRSGSVTTVRYLLNHGGDPMIADDKGRTVLHYAVASGGCKVTDFLISRGVPVDIDCGRGTPLYHAVSNEQDRTLKILLDHHADPNTMVSGSGTALLSAVMYRSAKCLKLLIQAGADPNGKGSTITPLVLATSQGGYTQYIKFLLSAGADPNIPDDLGRFPVELAALRNCKEEVKILFPWTYPIPNVPNWSIHGIISHAKNEGAKPLDQQYIDRREILHKSHADQAFNQDHKTGSEVYDLDISSNYVGACCRQAAAHMLVKEYDQARDALLDAKKLDPGSAEIERELRKVTELMQKNRGRC